MGLVEAFFGDVVCGDDASFEDATCFGGTSFLGEFLKDAVLEETLFLGELFKDGLMSTDSRTDASCSETGCEEDDGVSLTDALPPRGLKNCRMSLIVSKFQHRTKERAEK